MANFNNFLKGNGGTIGRLLVSFGSMIVGKIFADKLSKKMTADAQAQAAQAQAQAQAAQAQAEAQVQAQMQAQAAQAQASAQESEEAAS